MKFMIEFEARRTGNPDHNIEVYDRLLNAFDRWDPPEGLEIVGAYDRLDGTSGYLIIESADEELLTAALTRFAPFARVEVHPILEFDRSVPISRESLDWTRTVGF